MDTERFDGLIASASRTNCQSRRTAIHGIIAGAVAALGFVSGVEPGEASKAGKRRRRRRKREAQQRRQRCLDACGATCTLCFFDIHDAIVCGVGATADCGPFSPCNSNFECGTGNACLTAVQTRGSSVKSRFLSECDRPDGICETVTPCPPT